MKSGTHHSAVLQLHKMLPLPVAWEGRGMGKKWHYPANLKPENFNCMHHHELQHSTYSKKSSKVKVLRKQWYNENYKKAKVKFRSTHATKAYILNLSTRWRWVVSFMPQLLYPSETVPGTHWIGSWMVPTAGLGFLEKTKIPCFCHDLNLRSPSPQPCHYTNCTTKAPNRKKINKNINKWWLEYPDSMGGFTIKIKDVSTGDCESNAQPHN